MRTRPLAFVVVGVVALIAVMLAFVPGSARWLQSWRGRPASETSAPVSVPAPSLADSGGVPARAEVSIDPRRQQLIGIRLVAVRRTTLAQEIRVPGIVRVDERRQSEITTKVDGWVRDLRADYTGRTIVAGEPLFSLYSPALLAAQNEYLLALRGHASAAGAELPSVREYAERLRAAARERLLRFDLTDADIAELEQRDRATDTVTFRSPVTGTIVEKIAVEGMRVTAGQTLFRVADLSIVWVEADVPDADLALVRAGQSATITLAALPDQPMTGRATYVSPTVDEQTRTARVRFELANRAGRLKPGMFGTVQMAAAQTSVLAVPVDAVLEAGRDQLVFVSLGDGRFEPRPVTVGRRTRDEIEIASGLKEGEQVATGAAFLLDSESQLRAAVQGFQAPPEAPGSAALPQLDISFRSQPDPPRTGENTFEVTVRDPAGQPVADADVSVTFFMPAMPAMNMPAIRNQSRLPSAGGGLYRGTGQMVTAGRWDVTIDVTKEGQRLGSRQFAIVAR